MQYIKGALYDPVQWLVLQEQEQLCTCTEKRVLYSQKICC
jgi:hypothetical protein